MDDDRLRDDIAAWAAVRLDRLQPGLRVLHLYDANGVLSKGILLVGIRKRCMPVSDAAVKADQLAADVRKLSVNEGTRGL